MTFKRKPDNNNNPKPKTKTQMLDYTQMIDWKLQFLCPRCPHRIHDDRNRCCPITEGHLDCLITAHVNGHKWHHATTSLAAEKGHLNIIKYAYENGAGWCQDTMREAATKGYIDIIKYAHENGCPWYGGTIAAASAATPDPSPSHMECVLYAYANGAPFCAMSGHVVPKLMRFRYTLDILWAEPKETIHAPSYMPWITNDFWSDPAPVRWQTLFENGLCPPSGHEATQHWRTFISNRHNAYKEELLQRAWNPQRPFVEWALEDEFGDKKQPPINL